MIEFHIPDMSCGHCVKTLRTAFDKALPGHQIDIDLATREVRSDDTDPRVLAEAIRAAGYEARTVD